MKTLRQLLVVALVVATTGSYAVAQTFTGGLRGAVKDANGVIPGVTVQLINEGTSVAREVVSNDSGEYNFAAVPPGTYTVKASRVSRPTRPRASTSGPSSSSRSTS
jgi:hypothetical protein